MTFRYSSLILAACLAIASAATEQHAAEQAEVSHALRTFPAFATAFLAAVGVFVILCWAACWLYDVLRHRSGGVGSARAKFLRLHWLAWGFAATVCFLLAHHLLLRGLAAGVWDVDAYFYPYYVLVADFARAGHLLLWDPWSNGGLPMLGNPQVGAFSPVTLLVGMITGGTSSGFITYWLLIWWLGGAGMFVLARHLKVPSWGAAAVALGFVFCGGYTGHAEHPSYLVSLSALPWVIWRLDAALCARRWQPACEAGALWGLSALSGYPALTIISGCFVALWALGRYLCGGDWRPQVTQDRRPGLTSWGFVLSTLIIILVIGAVVFSPTFVAFFFEGAGTHTRVGTVSRDFATAFSLYPGMLVTAASPYSPLVQLYNDIWPLADVSFSSIYAGVLITGLALFALVNRPRDAWRWWLAGVSVLSIACAMGRTLPLRGWLYDWFYPMRFFRGAFNFQLYYFLPVSVLALLATADIGSALGKPGNRQLWRRLRWSAAALAACAIIVTLAVIRSRWSAGIPAPVKFIGIGHLSLWLGFAAVPVVLLRLPDSWRPRVFPLMILCLAAADAFVTSTLSIPETVRLTAAQRWHALDRQHSASLQLPATMLRQESSCYPDPPCTLLKNDQVIKKTAVLNAYASEENGFHLEMVNDPILRAMALGKDRIWFSRDALQMEPTRAAFTAFVARTESLAAPPLVIHSPEAMLKLRHDGWQARASRPEDMLLLGVNHARDASFSARLQGERLELTESAIYRAKIAGVPGAQTVAVNLIRYLPDELVFGVVCPSPGWLLVTDRWARSWHAEVNGQPTPVYGGDFIFRAVRVRAGQNRIRMVYRPVEVPWLVALSWGTLMVIGGATIYRRFYTTSGQETKMA